MAQQSDHVAHLYPLPMAKDNHNRRTFRNGDHPVQQAWVENNVPQCGYCQAGQIMSAAALLKVNPNPSEDDIISGMHGNICRCGTYNRIKEAIQSVAKNGDVG